MNTNGLIGKYTLLAIVLVLAMVTGGTAFAGKGGNGQTGNGGGGGGNTSPDPEYAIQADMVADGCVAYNPDLKGPGIAFGGFYDYADVAPITCAAVTTSSGASFYIRTLGVVSDESGLITAVWLRGRDDDGALFDGAEVPITQFPAPVDGSDFTLVVGTTVDMQRCVKVKGKTTCTSAGGVYIGNLVYANIGF